MLFSFSSSIVVNHLYAENNLTFLRFNARSHPSCFAWGDTDGKTAGALPDDAYDPQLADVIMALNGNH